MSDDELDGAPLNGGEVERLNDLLDRTERAAKSVTRLAKDSAVAKSAFAATEGHRLEGKAEGIRLAASYIRETRDLAEQASQ